MPSPTRRNRASVGPPLLSADCACCGGATGANARSLHGPHGGHARGPGRHRHRRQGRVLRPVAELTEVIGTPAVGLAARGHAARVIVPGPDRREREPARDSHRRRRLRCRTVPDPAVRVGTPAVSVTACRNTTCVSTPRTDRREMEAARDGYGRRLFSRRPVPDLAMGIAAPTIRRAVSGQAAAVCTTRTDRREGEPARDRHRAERLGVGAVAQLPRSVGTPAVWRAARGHTAGVTAPRADRGEAEPARDRRSRRGVHEDKAAGAECTTQAGAPTVRHAARGQTASVCTTRTDRCKREAAQHCSRRVRRPGSSAATAAVASLTVGTHAPTVRGAVCRHAAHCRTAPRTGAREHQSTPHRQWARPGERLLGIRIHPSLPAPERTPEVVAPAVRRAVRGHTATLAGPGIHEGERRLHGKRAARRAGATSSPFAVQATFTFVDAGTRESCGVTTHGAAYCWGNNLWGSLGSGKGGVDATPQQPFSWPSPLPVWGGLVFTGTSAGRGSAVCGVTTNGAAYCWGMGSDGQRGDGRGGGTGARSANTPRAVLGGLTFTTISAGGAHTCGVTTSGVAYCWGSGLSGALGTGSFVFMYTAPTTPVAGGFSFATVSAGSGHTCGVTTSGAPYCWGSNGSGQLGDGTTTQSFGPVSVAGGLAFTTISAGGAYSCGLTTDGTAYCWGSNSHGELGDGTAAQQVTPVPVAGNLRFATISAGSAHTCSVTTSGDAYCWGANPDGRLGDGTTSQAPTPVRVAGGFTFATVRAGDNHSCGVTTSREAYCWGANDLGQLGNGTQNATLTPVPVATGTPSMTAMRAVQ